ncbi:MAG: arginine repressor [Acidimicrobiia bacterium]
MAKRERHRLILRLVGQQQLGTQAELTEALRGAGVDVVQSTVSRDIAQLGLIKVRSEDGRLLYATPGTVDQDKLGDLEQALQRWAMTIEATGNLVVITTPSGFADPLAQAIDECNHPMVLGTIAGENTIFVAATAGTSGEELRDVFVAGRQSGPAGTG